MATGEAMTTGEAMATVEAMATGDVVVTGEVIAIGKAEVQRVQAMLDGRIFASKAKRKRYTKEFKLQVVQFYRENN